MVLNVFLFCLFSLFDSRIFFHFYQLLRSPDKTALNAVPQRQDLERHIKYTTECFIYVQMYIYVCTVQLFCCSQSKPDTQLVPQLVFGGKAQGGVYIYIRCQTYKIFSHQQITSAQKSLGLDATQREQCVMEKGNCLCFVLL